MKVLCKAHKDNMKLVIFLGIILLLCPISLSILMYKHKFIMWFFIGMSILYILGFILLVVRQALTKNDIVLVDENEKKFVVHRYFKKYCFTISDILEIKFNNKGLGSLGPLIFVEIEYFGSILFVLKNGEKIRTPLIDDVVERYDDIKKIIDEIMK